MSRANDQPRVIPAQLNFLVIYNPSLGYADDTLKDQIVYYYSRDGSRPRRREENSEPQKDVLKNTHNADEEENEKLRQVGLAQGMVDFARNFSNGVNVDTIDTEKSRIVLHELETGWWILASIDLTRLPVTRTHRDKTTSTDTEYSAREVSPAKLLITDLVRGHSMFLLHHAAKLTELYDRTSRSVFCGLLERYWNNFVKDWDVLLHGNPATAIYNSTKLAGGGELGVGVGEEEWGSGEREVLEGFMERTEGLIDLIVGRYGEALPEKAARNTGSPDRDNSVQNIDPWLGKGNDADAADGIIFTGRANISKRSLRSISQWMESIFKYGDKAYGVGENPSSRPRQRRKRPKTDRKVSQDHQEDRKAHEHHSRLKSSHGSKDPDLRRRAIENNVSPPGIPAPLVGQVERSLDEAIAKASQRSQSRSSRQETSEDEALTSPKPENGGSGFGTDNVMKYLTLGYGSSWTLNPNGFNRNKSPEPKQSGDQRGRSSPQAEQVIPSTITADEQKLQEIDPTPEVSDDEAQPFRQRLEQSVGKFLIGLSGDLEEAELNSDDEEPEIDKTSTRHPREQRLFLRTLTLEMARPINPRKLSAQSISKNSFRGSIGSTGSTEEPKTSAAASVDGAHPNITHEKLQVAIYVHQPFIFVFLFALHTPNLTMPAFYRSIHNQLGPLQKPLLRSTDPVKVAQRIADVLNESSSSKAGPHVTGNTIHDLIYDAGRLTVRTSIPNIPIPGSLAAEGIRSQSSLFTVSGSWYTLGIPVGSTASTSGHRQANLVKSSWTRVEAINVHTQALNTYMATRNNTDFEYTAKTSRGWWVLWMKIAPRDEHNGHREALLVRKAPDHTAMSSTSRSISGGPGKWLLRDQPRDVSNGSSASAGISSAKGVSDAVGVDARKWVDALLHLTQ